MHKRIVLKSLALFLVLSQFVTMAHAFEHDSAHEANEQCYICLHKTEQDNAITNTSSLLIPLPPSGAILPFNNKVTCLISCLLPNSRSPPVTL